MFRDKPRHDWTSHAADAFRYTAINWREEAKPEDLEDKPIVGLHVGETEVTLNDLWTSKTPTTQRRI